LAAVSRGAAGLSRGGRRGVWPAVEGGRAVVTPAGTSIRATSEARTRGSAGLDPGRWFAAAPRRCLAARRAAAAWAAWRWAVRESATAAVSIARL
jgi:hypothetical protein